PADLQHLHERARSGQRLGLGDDVVRQWRLAKGTVAESAFEVAKTAMKACGTSNTTNGGPIARGLRDLSMGLVQAFPAEKGRLEAASFIVAGQEGDQFAGRKA
ncbi:MAG: hypothetical protein AAGK32_10640, partial [Actinomycetota bacterium]